MVSDDKPPDTPPPPADKPAGPPARQPEPSILGMLISGEDYIRRERERRKQHDREMLETVKVGTPTIKVEMVNPATGQEPDAPGPPFSARGRQRTALVLALLAVAAELAVTVALGRDWPWLALILAVFGIGVGVWFLVGLRREWREAGFTFLGGGFVVLVASHVFLTLDSDKEANRQAINWQVEQFIMDYDSVRHFAALGANVVDSLGNPRTPTYFERCDTIAKQDAKVSIWLRDRRPRGYLRGWEMTLKANDYHDPPCDSTSHSLVSYPIWARQKALRAMKASSD